MKRFLIIMIVLLAVCYLLGDSITEIDADAFDGGLPLDVWQDGNGHLWVENAFYRWDVTHGSSLIIKEGGTWRDWRSVYNQQYYLVLGRNSPGTGGTQGGKLEMSDLTVVSINNDGQVATVELTGTFSRENRQATLVFTFSRNSGIVKLQGQITNVPTTPNPSGLHTSFSLVPGGDVTGTDDFYHYSGQASESGFPYGTGVHIPRTSFLPVGQTDYAYITNYDKSHCQGFAIITELSKTTDFITDINYGIAQIWDTHHYLNWSNMCISPNVTVPFTLFFYFYETDPVVAYQPVEDLINSGTLDGESATVCNAFLTAKKVNVGPGDAAKPGPGSGNAHVKHDFKIHIIPCEPMNVSVGDSADVFVDADKSGTFDQDENYLAIVSSTDLDSQATDIAIKVYIGEDLINNDPCVAIYSINNIPIVDTLGNPIDYLCLNTFDPHGPYDGNKSQVSEFPENVTLMQNYPNPFNPICNIEYALSTDCQVALSIYNILGQKVRVLVDEYQDAGFKSVKWDGKDDQGREVASGVYFYRLQAKDFVQSKKMVLLR